MSAKTTDELKEFVKQNFVFIEPQTKEHQLINKIFFDAAVELTINFSAYGTDFDKINESLNCLVKARNSALDSVVLVSMRE